MFVRTILAFALASLAIAKPLAQAPFRITTPETIAQCTPATFTWTATVAPYYLTIHHADSDALFTAEEDPIVIRSANTAAWIIDYPAGTLVRVHVRDATGEVTATLPMLVGEGYTDCMEE